FQAADEPAYLTVGTDVSAKYRGAFCEAKIKTVKRMVKVKVTLKGESASQVVQDDQVKGPLRVGSTVEVKTNEGLCSEAVISKLTDASLYTVVFDDGDEKTLRRTSLCLKGERHFAESEVTAARRGGVITAQLMLFSQPPHHKPLSECESLATIRTSCSGSAAAVKVVGYC
uniref:Tudor domain-containing protein n=1 Tax=Oryzias melastigma TaxID=30732 RepID=A0A3B3DUH4_ORYME